VAAAGSTDAGVAMKTRAVHEPRLGWPFTAVACLALIGPTLYWDGGVLDDEAVRFVVQYNDDRPLLHKVFDPHLNDIGTYQARELSYFFDYIDARIYEGVSRHLDPSFFVPLSAVIVPVLIVLVFARGVRRTAPHIDAWTGALVLSCLFTSFVSLSTFGVFYRSGKALLALVTLAFLFHVRRTAQCRGHAAVAPRQWLTRAGALAFTLAVLAGLLDRQGMFYVVMASGILLLHVAFTGQLKDLLLSTVLACVALGVYNRVMAPWAVHTLNGYWPTFEYQTITREMILHVPSQTMAAAHGLLQNAVALLGGAWPISLACVVAAGGIVLRARTRTQHGTARTASPCNRQRLPVHLMLVYGLCASAGHVLMFALMITRHAPVYYWLDHRFWYYPLPYLMFVLFGLTIVIEAGFRNLDHRGRRLSQGVLLVAVLGNIATLVTYRDMMLAGPWFGPVSVQSELLKSALRRGVPHTGLDADRRNFFDFATGARSDATALER
jgi:hypothetical protein